jgi:hypothetical protein
VEQILEALRQATGVSLVRGGEIQNEYPAVGSLSVRNVPAWQIMEQVAASKFVQGKWQSDGEGYRLVSNGQPVALPTVPVARVPPPPPAPAQVQALPAPAPHPQLRLMLLTAFATVVVLVMAALVVWQRLSLGGRSGS